MMSKGEKVEHMSGVLYWRLCYSASIKMLNKHYEHVYDGIKEVSHIWRMLGRQLT